MKNVIVAMDQPIYAMDLLYNFVMTEAKPVAYFMDLNIPLQKTEKSNEDDLAYNELVRSLMYVATFTITDIKNILS